MAIRMVRTCIPGGESLERRTRARAAVTDIAYAILDASLADPRDCETLISTALGVLRETIGADSAGFYRHTYGGMTTALLIDPAPLWKAIPAPELPTATACAIHPGVRHLIGRR